MLVPEDFFLTCTRIVREIMMAVGARNSRSSRRSYSRRRSSILVVLVGPKTQHPKRTLIAVMAVRKI